MIRRPPRSTLSSSSAASDVYKRQAGFLDQNTGPSREDPHGVQSILDKARKPGEASGGGRRLGDEGSEGQGARSATVTFWKDGFTMHEPLGKQPNRRRGQVTSFSDLSKQDGGSPLSDMAETLRGGYNDTEHEQFVRDIREGLVPRELRSVDPVSQLPVRVDISLFDQRDTPMPAPQAPAHGSFAGQGQSLAQGTCGPPEAPVSVAPATLGNSLAVGGVLCLLAQYAGGWKAAAVTGLLYGLPVLVLHRAELNSYARGAVKHVYAQEFILDPTQPLTTIKLRQPDGSALTEKFNQSHTVRQMHARLSEVTKARVLELLSGYPPRALEVSDLSLKDAGLLNAQLTQRFKSE
eukprot:TRINITY_DN14345_c0_g1_i2.p1 TRINITY_DN14345_c0_g1~~TRINITY_DN14345_c0_g1_i2.p1  ORF type:complete len:350 (-),score=56.21 TRINITY_DN14345_c0_g1_i2:313-1362(-)